MNKWCDLLQKNVQKSPKYSQTVYACQYKNKRISVWWATCDYAIAEAHEKGFNVRGYDKKDAMTQKQKKALESWERELRKALDKGQGKYQEEWACDIHDCMKLLDIVKSNNLKKAHLFWEKLDTYVMELVPDNVVDIFEDY